MKTLIVEDDFTCRLLLQEFLKSYGVSHIAINGQEAIDAVKFAAASGEPYDLICLDLMMPDVDGHTALKEIRDMEEARGILSTHGVKIVMTTALGDPKSVVGAYWNLCDAYVVKPIEKGKLLTELRKLGLIE